MYIASEELVANAALIELPARPLSRPEVVNPLVNSRRGVNKQPLRFQLYGALVAQDGLSVLTAFLAANLMRFGNPLATEGVTLLVVLLPIFAVLSFNSGAYGLEVLRKPRLGVFRSVLSLCQAVAVILLAAFCFKVSSDFSRAVLAGGAMGSVGLLTISRFLFGKFALRQLGGSPLSEVIIFDGVDLPETDFAEALNAAEIGLMPDPHDPQMLHRLGTVLNGVDRVLIACKPERRALWALLLKGANVQGEVLASELEEIGAIGIGRFGSRTTLSVSCGPLDLRSCVLKRALDLAFTVPVILVLAPLFLVIACAIKLESPGPIFFVQKRLGRGNRLFSMLKFRSMRADQCDAAGTRSTDRYDERVTRVGRFIRASSMDELPQLLNVLKGDMSLVGPRPHALGSTAGAKLFWEVDQRYWHRHACKPGITGLAQVRGFRGATHESGDLTNRLHADLEYLSGWSIWRELAILLRTFRVLVHHNAY